MDGVIYARYSCDRQTENSILGQVRECTDFARKEGINIVRIYKDEAISGRTATKRPGFMQMINEAASRQFQCVIVWKGDRFSRSRADAAKYKSELKKYGVRVLSATEANVTGPEAILMDGINEAFAEYFSVELAAKVVRGMTQNVIEGKWTGARPPLGYKIDENRKVVFDEDKAFIVKEAFNRYMNEGMSAAAISRLFNEKGYTNVKGKPFTSGTIHNILRNKRYCGIFGFKGTYNMNVIPPLISKEEFDVVQKIMKNNQRDRGKFRGQETYYLKGKVFCLYDGLPIKCEHGTSKTGKIHYYYRCAHAKQQNHPTVTIRKTYLEDTVFNQLFQFFRNEPVSNLIIDKLVKRFKEEQKDIKPLKAMLDSTNKKITAIMNAIESGADIDIFLERLKELKQIKAKQENEIKNSVCFTEEEFRKALASTLSYAFDPENYENDKAMRQWFVSTFINKIYLSDQLIVIMFKYNNRFYDNSVALNYSVHYTNTMVHQLRLMGLIQGQSFFLA